MLTVVYGVDSIRQLARKIGRIAQLEERCPYKAEVTGSIPVPPTNKNSGDSGPRHCLSISSDVQESTPPYLAIRFLNSESFFRHLGLCGAVVQPGLGRQIVNLEVAGSNPVGPAIPPAAGTIHAIVFR